MRHYSNLAESPVSEAGSSGFKTQVAHQFPRSPMAEAMDSKPIQSRFDSEGGNHVYGRVSEWRRSLTVNQVPQAKHRRFDSCPAHHD